MKNISKSNIKQKNVDKKNDVEKLSVNCKKTNDICNVLNIGIAFLALIATIWIGFGTSQISKESNKIMKKTQELSREANKINKKQEELIYNVVGGEEDMYYEMKIENSEIIKIPCKTTILDVKQGVIDILRVIVFDGNNITSMSEVEWEILDKVRLTDKGLGTKVGENVTESDNGICYDYFFLYIKSGADTEHLVLVYTEINTNEGERNASAPKMKTKLDLLEIENSEFKNNAYKEMMYNYQILHKRVEELSQNGMELY
ncbi:MAG: hypothetical protein IJA34_08560 [Lachnospiraceae bacterium]|nr:hypothetical protein [Lachnospiraceae bacterium]